MTLHPNRRLRVLQVIASLAPRYGGPTTVAIGLSRALEGRGHHVEIFTTNRGGAPARAAAGLRVSCFPLSWPYRYGVSVPLARALARHLRDFDVVHVHSLYLFHTLVSAFLCRRHGIPYVLRPHGTLDAYHRARHRQRKLVYDLLVERRNLRHAAAVHYASEAERAHAEAAGFRGRGIVAELGVDLAPFRDRQPLPLLLDRYPELSGRTLVSFLGRLTPKKGLDLLIDAFRGIADARPDAHLVIAGPDDEALGTALREQALRAGLEQRISFLGLVTDSKEELLRRSSVFVLPSQDENFAVAAVEAMAAGVPVILSREVAIHEEVARAGAGLVVPRTANDLAAAVLRLLEDRRLAANAGEAAARLAETTYSWDTRVLGVERMYKEAVVQR